MVDLHENDCMENTVILFGGGGGNNSQIVNARATFPPTCHIRRHQVKKLSMEAAECFWCVNMALSNVSACERFQGRAESDEKSVGRKVAQESCSSVQDFIEFY